GLRRSPARGIEPAGPGSSGSHLHRRRRTAAVPRAVESGRCSQLLALRCRAAQERVGGQRDGAVMMTNEITQKNHAGANVVDEALLVTAMRAGEEWAFDVMVRTFGGRLLAVARRICRNDEDARDVVQSAYLSAFRSLDGFEGACQLSTWLHRIVVNMALM